MAELSPTWRAVPLHVLDVLGPHVDHHHLRAPGFRQHPCTAAGGAEPRNKMAVVYGQQEARNMAVDVGGMPMASAQVHVVTCSSAHAAA